MFKPPTKEEAARDLKKNLIILGTVAATARVAPIVVNLIDDLKHKKQ